jgi:hypothetical protein
LEPRKLANARAGVPLLKVDDHASGACGSGGVKGVLRAFLLRYSVEAIGAADLCRV